MFKILVLMLYLCIELLIIKSSIIVFNNIFDIIISFFVK